MLARVRMGIKTLLWWHAHNGTLVISVARSTWSGMWSGGTTSRRRLRLVVRRSSRTDVVAVIFMVSVVVVLIRVRAIIRDIRVRDMVMDSMDIRVRDMVMDSMDIRVSAMRQSLRPRPRH
jgi:hypothetical protein